MVLIVSMWMGLIILLQIARKDISMFKANYLLKERGGGCFYGKASPQRCSWLKARGWEPSGAMSFQFCFLSYHLSFVFPFISSNFYPTNLSPAFLSRVVNKWMHYFLRLTMRWNIIHEELRCVFFFFQKYNDLEKKKKKQKKNPRKTKNKKTKNMVWNGCAFGKQRKRIPESACIGAERHLSSWCCA